MNENPLREKFTKWKECLEGANSPVIDPNSVQGVIGTLFWEMGAYNGYEAICKADHTSPFATLLFGRLTAFNYIQVQALRVRRLCEPYNAPGGKKDTSIYSLRRLVDEMKQARKAGIFTRENICDIYGAPTSMVEVKRILDDSLAAGDSRWVAAGVWGNMLNMLDNICDKNGLISKRLIDELDKRLQVVKNAKLSEIYYFVDKNIAHSSSQSSRDQVATDLALRVADMKTVIQGIAEAHFCLNMLVTQADQHGLVAVGWDEQLGNLTRPQATLVTSAYKSIESESEIWKLNGYGLLGLEN